jgi:HK97 family phage major capsid protein
MNELERLQKLFREAMAKLKTIRAIKPEDLTDDNRTERDAILTEIDTLTKDIDAEKRAMEIETRDDFDLDDLDDGIVTIEDQPIYRGTHSAAFGQQMCDVAAVTDPNGIRGLPLTEARSRLEQNTKRAMTLIEKRQGKPVSKEFEERSMKPLFSEESRAAGTGMIQGVGSEGGFLLQSETSIDLMTSGFNNSEVLKRCNKRTLTGSESLEIVGIDETSRADGSRGGGVRVYTDAELSQMTSSQTKFQKIKLAPERMTGLYYASDKILMNATFLGQEMRQLFTEEFAFKSQDLVVEGTGAGQALGLKNTDCKISIAKETDQVADTILADNVLKMLMRFYLRGGDGNVVWLTNRNCYKELRSMAYAIGTGGELARMYIPPRRPGEKGSMEGFPVVFIEQAESLGDAGDLWLCDFSQYLCVDYGDINEASSIHFKFDYSQTTFRFVYYFDGQPRLVSPITPFKGSSSTVSPFVRIAERA